MKTEHLHNVYQDSCNVFISNIHRLLFRIALNYKSSNVKLEVSTVLFCWLAGLKTSDVTTRKTNILKVGMHICST